MDSVHHPVFARLYRRVASTAEKAGAAEHRAELLAGLSGRVIEVGAGTGLNFAYYPPEVTEVVAVEPEPSLRRFAAQAAAGAPVPVTVVDGVAGQLPAAEAAFDAAVCSLVLCSVPDQGDALAEIRRVIRPGGQLRFYEHVRASDARRARIQDRVDRIWSLLSGGCHPGRNTEAAITGAGFSIRACRRFTFEPCRLCAPAAPYILGNAVRQ